MNCEEFEEHGLDGERDNSLTAEERAAALEHAAGCPRCSALQDSWMAASEELRLFAAGTHAAEAPARVEMRLRQEFRTRRHTVKVRRFATWATAALATAAVITGFVVWRDSRIAKGLVDGTNTASVQNVTNSAATDAGDSERTNSANAESLVASTSDGTDFTPLPGSVTGDLDDAAVVRVRMQWAALEAWGLPISEERANEWIQVDLLVGEDGQPQGVRLSR